MANSDRRQLDRIERKLDHNHEMLHALSTAVAALAESPGDNARLAAASAALSAKSVELQAALDAAEPSP